MATASVRIQRSTLRTRPPSGAFLPSAPRNPILPSGWQLRTSRELAKSLLWRDFGLDVELPDSRLCPMIPNRCSSTFPLLRLLLFSSANRRGWCGDSLDYVLWIQDLVDSTSCDLPSELDPSAPVLGLDVLPSPSRPTILAAAHVF